MIVKIYSFYLFVLRYCPVLLLLGLNKAAQVSPALCSDFFVPLSSSVIPTILPFNSLRMCFLHVIVVGKLKEPWKDSNYYLSLLPPGTPPVQSYNVMVMMKLCLVLLVVGFSHASRTRGTDYTGATDWTTGPWSWITRCFRTTSTPYTTTPTTEPISTEGEPSTFHSDFWSFWTDCFTDWFSSDSTPTGGSYSPDWVTPSTTWSTSNMTNVSYWVWYQCTLGLATSRFASDDDTRKEDWYLSFWVWKFSGILLFYIIN